MNTLTPHINSDTRLYALDGPAPFDQMHVERWTGFEQLSNLFPWDLLTLSPEHDIAFDKMLGQILRLHTTLAEGSSVRAAVWSSAYAIKIPTAR